MARITGQLYRIEQTVEENGYKRRSFVLFVKNERYEQYSDYIQFELNGEKTGIIDMFQQGDKVEVEYSVRGRRYNRKDGSGEAYFVTLQAYGITKPAEAPSTYQAPAPAPAQKPAAQPAAAPKPNNEELPF